MPPQTDRAETPLRHDGVTIPCPICTTPFVAAGRRLYCSEACKARAYRRRRAPAAGTVVVPPAQPRRSITVYQCEGCATTALGDQRCQECNTFMRRIGLGGACPHCDEAVTVTELLGEEVRP